MGHKQTLIISKMNPPKIFQLLLNDITPDGCAVGIYKNKLYAVPFAIPGEVINARVVDESSDPAQAEGVTLLEASADRVSPRCKHFGPGKCGGCQWQHMRYAAQIALKTDIVAACFEHIGGFKDAPIRLAIESPLQWGYASQTTFWVTNEGELGFRAADRRHIIPVEECHIVEAALLTLTGEIDFDIESVDEIRVQLGTGGNPMLTLRSQSDEPPELENNLPVSINFLLRDKEPFNLVGSTHTMQRLLNREFRVAAGSDFRANRLQIERLVEAVLRYLDPQPEDGVLDLFGGVGVFSAFIAPHVQRVTYVDSYPPAATDAESNLADLSNIDIIEGSVQDVLEDILDDLEDQAPLYTAAIVDPPHTGLTDGILQALGKLHLPRLIYVSQNPETLAADAQRLVREFGYRLVEIQPVDFAPQTALVHCVALFKTETKT